MRIYQPQNDRIPGVIGFHTNDVPKLDSGNIKVTLDYFNDRDYVVRGKTLSNIFFLQQQHNKNKAQVIQTAINRYTKASKKCPNFMIDRHLAGLDKFMKPNWREQMLADFHSDGNGGKMHMWRSVCSYLRKLQTKLGDLNRNLPDTDELIGIRSHSDFISNMNRFMNFNATHCKSGDFKRTIALSANDCGFNYNVYKTIKYILNSETSKLKDLEAEFTSSYHKLIQFHLKTQPKEIREYGCDRDWETL